MRIVSSCFPRLETTEGLTAAEHSQVLVSPSMGSNPALSGFSKYIKESLDGG